MKRILAVNDDPMIQKTLEQAFERDFIITKVTSETEIIQALRRNSPDIVIVNCGSQKHDRKLCDNIETMDGIEDMPVFFLVDTDQMKECQKSFKVMAQTGVFDIVIKPLVPFILRNRVDIHLELAERRKKAYEVIKFQDAISVSFAELVECRDVTTGGHLKNTTKYFKILLEEVARHDKYKEKISREDIVDLLRAAPLHDVGKIGISDEVLQKASPLNFNEFEYMKTHTILGKETFEKIIKETGETKLLLFARELAYHHHERWDGTGYPNGLKGEEIPLNARILTIADVYDALTSDRAYKEAYPHKIATEIIIDGRGSMFDPSLIDIFEEINDRFELVLHSNNGTRN